jgi:putative transposase
MPDHIHISIGYNINHLIPDMVEEIKTSSNAWIKNEQEYLEILRKNEIEFKDEYVFEFFDDVENWE